MDLKLKNKKALVCASSKGLGKAIAQSLAAEGADLCMCARNEDELNKSAQEIRDQFGVKVITHAVDLSIPGNIDEFAQVVKKSLGPVDILINNIGGPPPSAATETNEEQWRRGFEQVFLSATLLTRALLPDMQANGFGRILTVTSLSVLEPIDHLVVSTAMRAAITSYSKTLAKEVAGAGVTVNTIMPGVIHTDRIESLRKAKAQRDGTKWEDEMDATRKLIPMGRLGKPEEFADLVTFLASPKAAYITGMNVSVDGGLRKGW
jgi:3-oxoacyl-[acyl-carrier protein] reductase